MKFSSDEISSMFEDIIFTGDDKQNTKDKDGQESYFNYAACPNVCASRGGEDWWC